MGGAGGWAEPEVGEKRVQGDNVVERCREEGSRANKRDMTVSALRPLRFAPPWCPSEDSERIARRSLYLWQPQLNNYPPLENFDFTMI